jgi:hypothetical protein
MVTDTTIFFYKNFYIKKYFQNILGATALTWTVMMDQSQRKRMGRGCCSYTAEPPRKFTLPAQKFTPAHPKGHSLSRSRPKPYLILASLSLHSPKIRLPQNQTPHSDASLSLSTSTGHKLSPSPHASTSATHASVSAP